MEKNKEVLAMRVTRIDPITRSYLNIRLTPKQEMRSKKQEQKTIKEENEKHESKPLVA
jgi:hypothetical protein